MKKKVVALMLSLAVAVSALSGCGNEASTGTNETTKSSTSTGSSASAESSDATESSAEEEITADYFAGTELTIAIVAKPDDQSTDFNEKPIFKLMEEETGIHINWIVIDEGVSEEKKGVMLASKDQPDAYISMIRPTDVVNSPELFYDLSEEGLLEKWAPNLYQEYAVEHPTVLEALTWSDGSIYSLPINSYAAAETNWLQSFPSINMEWLEKLDMEVPTNADELYEVLVAFRDNDMNGNGDTTDEIPFTFQTGSWKADLSMMMQMWGIAGGGSSVLKSGRMLKEGEVVSTFDTENFRNYLEYMHKLYAEDLLDKEGFTQTSEQYGAKQGAETSIVGVSLTWNNSNFKQEEGVYQLFYFQGMEGVEPYFMGSKNANALSDWSAFGFVPTADSNIEAVLHWWNYMGSTEEMKQIAYGNVEGVHYEVLDNGMIQRFDSPALGDPDYVDVWTNGLHNNSMPSNPNKVIDPEYTDYNKERVEFLNAIIDSRLCAAEGEDWPYRIAPADKLEECSFIELELKEYIDSFHAEAIMNGVTDASWEAHLEQLKAVGYYEWLDYWKCYVANSWE